VSVLVELLLLSHCPAVRLHKPKYNITGNICQRVQQCEKCRKKYNRDLAAACNIAFAAWHWLVWGCHPFDRKEGTSGLSIICAEADFRVTDLYTSQAITADDGV